MLLYDPLTESSTENFAPLQFLTFLSSQRDYRDSGACVLEIIGNALPVPRMAIEGSRSA